jgi:CO/xanthine dehydrogenase FAD-binding subunit
VQNVQDAQGAHMKAAPFDYVRADNLEQVLSLLAEHGGDAKLLAGGQSLVPMMAMRLARPALLVDINRLASLKSIQPTASTVTMGAGVRQRDVEDARTLDAPLPLVQQALRWVGHAQTRNRGTVGGSLVHADPSAELPLAALVLDATMRLHSQTDGERSVSAQDFFLGPMFTAVGETECLTAIDWPVWQGNRVASAFDETAIRHGDFAMASAACQVQLDANGAVSRASMGVGGVSGAPLAFPVFAAQLVGHRITPALAQELAQAAAKQCDPGSDMHASAEFRGHLAATLLARVLVKAAAAAASQLAG